MDDVIQMAVLLAALGAAEPARVSAAPQMAASARVPAAPQIAAASARRLWPGEDKFRHVAMSWAITTFTYAAARAAQQDGDTSLAIAVPVSAAAGIAKEVLDRRRGGPFSARDLIADALGTAVAYFFLREVH